MASRNREGGSAAQGREAAAGSVVKGGGGQRLRRGRQRPAAQEREVAAFGGGGRRCRGGRWRPASGGAGEALKPSIPHALSPSPDAPRPRPSLTRDGGVDVWELGREGFLCLSACAVRIIG